jgi:hypothetical protein
MPRKYVEMWNTGDLQLIGTMFAHPTFITFHGQKRLLETGTLARVIMSWRKSMPDLNFKVEDTIVQGDRVAMRLTFTGSYKERLFADTYPNAGVFWVLFHDPQRHRVARRLVPMGG